jgi:hypothetical protein
MTVAAVVGAFAGLGLVAADAAPAATTICAVGSGAGQCSDPEGIAVDEETGHIYIADRLNNRVDVFDQDHDFLFAFGWGVDTGAAELQKCTTASGCQAGIRGSGAGQFDRPTRVAVDNDPVSPSHHAVYVGTDNYRVKKFTNEGAFVLQFGEQGAGECQFENSNGSQDPLSVGPGGVVSVADTIPQGQTTWLARIHRFSDAGACIGTTPLETAEKVNIDLAVDDTGNSYLALFLAGGIVKFDSAGSEVFSRGVGAGNYVNAITRDASGAIYVQQREFRVNSGGSYLPLTEYDEGGAVLSRFGYDQIAENSSGIAVDPSGNGILVSDGDAVNLIAFPPRGPIAPASGITVAGVGNVRATVEAEINPEGIDTEYHFDYVDQAHFEEGGLGFDSPATKSTETEVLEASADPEEAFDVQAVQAVLGCAEASKQLIEEGKCLTPETTYHFRVVATNADGEGEGTAVGEPFETAPPGEILATWVTSVGTNEAGLRAEVDSGGIPTSGYFEYVDDASFQASGFASAKQAPEVGDGAAEIDFGSGEGAAVDGTSLSGLSPGTTYHYRLVATNPLIEAPLVSAPRAFRTFSQPTVEGCPNDTFRTRTATFLPDCRAYEMVSPVDKGNGDIVVLNAPRVALPAVLNRTTPQGSKLAYGSYRSFGDAAAAPATTQYIAGRTADGWSSTAIAPPQSGGVVGVLGRFDTEFKDFSDDLCQAWLVTTAEAPLAPGGVPGYRNLYRQRLPGCPAPGYEALSPVRPPNISSDKDYSVQMRGRSSDGTHTVFIAEDNLVAGMPSQPSSCATSSVCLARLYEQVRGEGLRFVCWLPGESGWAGACVAGYDLEGLNGSSHFANVENAVSADGSHIFWTDRTGPGRIYVRVDGTETLAVSEAGEAMTGSSNSRYWSAAADGSKALYTTGADLYEFTLEGEATEKIAGGVIGLLGASEDASRVYLVSTEARDGEAEAGKHNLYLYEPGNESFHYIAQLSPEDTGTTTIENYRRTSRVSPDGLHAAFMSVASPTGYDNHAAQGGEPAAEVYLYDADADKLVCASCNPSGQRPSAWQRSTGEYVASQLPVWQNVLTGARVLSPDGDRLYFESLDALALRDTNGRGDVYQWEAQGTGGCGSDDAGFVPASGGCVDLISSGQSEVDSNLIEVSPSGDDVFFSTLSGFVPQDYGLIDIYDARVGGGYPAPAPSPAECEGEACQKPPPAPVFQSPAASSYVGPGNLSKGEKKPRKCKKGKHKVKHRGKVRCVKKKANKKRHVKHRRANASKGRSRR